MKKIAFCLSASAILFVSSVSPAFAQHPKTVKSPYAGASHLFAKA